MSTIDADRNRNCPSAIEQFPPLDVCEQQLTIFAAPLALMEAMIDDFRTARSRIWVEGYIIMDDWVGERMADVLIERATAGVDVRLMYDSVGSLLSADDFFEGLRDGGVQVHEFHPPVRSLMKFRFRRANLRDHRRVCVVDESIGYLGGMNIGDFGGSGSRRPASSVESAAEATWPDVHLRLEGPRQRDLAAAFESLWHDVHGQEQEQTPPWQLQELLEANDERICLFASDPRDPRRSPEQVFVPLFRQARESITLLISYFLPQGPVWRELLAARQRGVAVRVVVPQDSDVKAVQFASRHLYRELLRHQIEVYERQGQMLHSKAVVIDREWSVVGSCNLDPRSLWMNLEFFAAIRNRKLAAVLNEIGESHMAHSVRVTAEHLRGRPWWERGVDALAWWFRRWL